MPCRRSRPQSSIQRKKEMQEGWITHLYETRSKTRRLRMKIGNGKPQQEKFPYLRVAGNSSRQHCPMFCSCFCRSAVASEGSANCRPKLDAIAVLFHLRQVSIVMRFNLHEHMFRTCTYLNKSCNLVYA
mmetsp:Transcript_37210/g.67321  ORF Transcript_37210/g.67321 Transcript_37210/m.67321 type:complete len:129 (-) Transcript_37210:30-416(-)